MFMSQSPGTMNAPLALTSCTRGPGVTTATLVTEAISWPLMMTVIPGWTTPERVSTTLTLVMTRAFDCFGPEPAHRHKLQNKAPNPNHFTAPLPRAEIGKEVRRAIEQSQANSGKPISFLGEGTKLRRNSAPVRADARP